MRRAIVSGCALVALAGACSSEQKFQGGPVTTTTRLGPIISRRTQPTAAPTTAPGTTDPGTGDTVPPGTVPPGSGPLAALLITSVPTGFPQQIDSVADTGPTDLAKAARDDNNVNGVRALQVTGFVRGYQRAWTGVDSGGNDSQYFMFLYEFQSAKGAAGYADHWKLADQQNGRAATFVPAFMPGAAGLRIQDKTGSSGIVIFSKGVYAVRAIVNGASRENPAGAVTQFALAEFTKLP